MLGSRSFALYYRGCCRSADPEEDDEKVELEDKEEKDDQVKEEEEGRGGGGGRYPSVFPHERPILVGAFGHLLGLSWDPLEAFWIPLK